MFFYTLYIETHNGATQLSRNVKRFLAITIEITQQLQCLFLQLVSPPLFLRFEIACKKVTKLHKSRNARRHDPEAS